MKAEWTPSGGSVVTLGDDAAKKLITLEQFGVVAVEQVTPLFRAANPLRILRSNVAGDVVFTAVKSHASVDAASAYLLQEIGRTNQQGTLVLTIGTTTRTMAGATLRSVTLGGMVGVRLWVRYTFGITTVA